MSPIAGVPNTKRPKKRNRLAAWGVGLLLSLGLIYLGFSIFEGVITRADDESPRDVVVNSVTPTTATISWSTGVASAGGVVQYGTSVTSLSSFAPADAASSNDHSVTLSLLSPATTYYFIISYGENKVFDNGGVPWVLSTKPEGSSGGAQESELSPSPTPLVALPSTTPGVEPASVCAEKTCEAIKAKLGSGCQTRDYILCLRTKSQ